MGHKPLMSHAAWRLNLSLGVEQMGDVARYVGLMERQKDKLKYARTLIPILSEYRSNGLGPGRSLNEIVNLLNERGVRPQRGTKFVPQTLSDLVYCDHPQPTPDALAAEPEKRDGMRVAICRAFIKAKPQMIKRYGDERVEDEEGRLRDHQAAIVSIAAELRSVLGLRS